MLSRNMTRRRICGVSPRRGCWAAYKGKIYGAGGEVQNERYSAAFRSLESYDPVSNRWDILPSLPGAVHGNAVAFIGNKLHTVSGKMEGGGLAGRLGACVGGARGLLEDLAG